MENNLEIENEKNNLEIENIKKIILEMENNRKK